jgi:hypothetical protein
LILSTLQQLTANFVGDPDQTRYSGKYVPQINLAQDQFAADSRSLFKDVAYTSAVGTSTYGLPVDFLFENDVTYNGFPLKPISRHTLYTLYPGTDWTLLTGTPTHYMVDPEEANKVLRLIPIPQDIQTISMRYYPLPADVANPSDIVLNASLLMVQFHSAIAALAAWYILSFETQDDALIVKRKEMMKIYQDGVSKAIDTFKNTASEPLRVRPRK